MSHPDIHAHRILILDFGSQYTQLIARRVREIGVYCEIHPFDMADADIRAFAPRGIILAGGPESVHEAGSPRAPQAVFDLDVPIFGICYGMQTMAEQLGGKVEGSDLREFGYARVDIVGKARLLDGIEDHVDTDGVLGLDVWMSHGDKVTAMPAGFHILASTPSCPIAAMADDSRAYYGVQFHPEVTHTRQGARMLEHFVKDICGCECLWTPATIIDDAVARIREQVGDDEVILDIRSMEEHDDKPLVVEGREIMHIPFFKLATAFGDLPKEKTYLLYCDRGVMSKLQALYLKEQGFDNVKVYRP